MVQCMIAPRRHHDTHYCIFTVQLIFPAVLLSPPRLSSSLPLQSFVVVVVVCPASEDCLLVALTLPRTKLVTPLTGPP